MPPWNVIEKMRVILAALVLLMPGFRADVARVQAAGGENWQVLRTMIGHRGGVNSVAFSPDGQRTLSGSGAYRLWDLATGQTVRTLPGHTMGVVLSGSLDGTVHLWDLVKYGQTIKTLMAPSVGRPVDYSQRWVMSVAVSPDGTRVLSGSGDGNVPLDPSAYVTLPAPRVVAQSPSGAQPKVPPNVATSTSAPKPKSSPKLAEPNPAQGPAETDPWAAFKPIHEWTPLSADLRRLPLQNKQSPEELFAKARSSVWVVLATTLASQSAASPHVSQGSAVAITRSHLLTNYHVVDGRRLIVVTQGDQVLEATVVASDKESDRCVLAVTGEVFSPVDGLRGFEELRVGEQVYTIGSPSAVENTLGQGIVSGLLTVAGRHLVQTTAPISPGSSGGGLFDSAGNLVGITSFMLKTSQDLNFAIAAEDYFH
jgi:WD40 repeat protein